MDVYVIYSEERRTYAAISGRGKTSDDVADAKEFSSWSAASEFSQDYPPDFIVTALYEYQQDVDMSKVYREELPLP